MSFHLVLHAFWLKFLLDYILCLFNELIPVKLYHSIVSFKLYFVSNYFCFGEQLFTDVTELVLLTPGQE